jgi:hypothetical protein
LKRAETAFKKSIAFVPKNSKGNGNKQAWIESVGVYYYYSLLLADFNPVVADAIYNQPAHVIAEAYVSQMCHTYVDQ